MNKNKTIVYIHGFKRNGIDDFEQMHEYFDKYSSEYNLINLTYFDNYDKSTFKSKYLKSIINETLEKLSDQEEVILIGYSAGAIVASLISSKLPEKINIKLFAITPPVKIVMAKWIPLLLKQNSKHRKLRKKMGKERYNTLRAKREENKVSEKYPISIGIYINKLRKMHQSKLLKEKDATYLLAETDFFVNTPKVSKKLKRRNREFEIKDFQHDLLLSRDKQVFIDWFESKLKNH